MAAMAVVLSVFFVFLLAYGILDETLPKRTKDKLCKLLHIDD